VNKGTVQFKITDYRRTEMNCQQDMQCKYNVTLRRVRVLIFDVEKQWVLHILSVCL